MPSPQHGRFCWYDLMTLDLDSARDFYGKLLGWTVKQVDMGPHPYNMIHAGDRPIGGMVSLSESDKLPTHWIPYVFSDDLTKTCEQATGAGGQVHVPITDVGPGKFAVLGDPQGAFFSIWHSEDDDPGEPAKGTPGVFCWNECMSTDAAKGAEFYAGLFGWEPKAMEMEVGGCEMTYRTFEMGGEHRSGIMDIPPEARAQGIPPHWLSYVTVENVDEALEKAIGLGAMVLSPPTDIPHTGRFSVIRDPQGGTLSLFTYDAEMLK